VIGRHRKLILGALALAVAVRLGLAFATFGAQDVEHWTTIAGAAQHDLLGFYSEVNGGVFTIWAYPPGLVPWLVGAREASGLTGAPFHGVVQILPVVADAVLALLVLRLAPGSERARLAAAALVLAGPVFVLISGHHGQFDSVALVPCVLALGAWERSNENRSILVGSLLGVGLLLKPLAVLVLLGLIPTSRSLREALVTVGCAAAVPAASLMPFVLVDGTAPLEALAYGGVPGFGGLALLSDPSWAEPWLFGDRQDVSGLGRVVGLHGVWITAPVIGVAFALLVRARTGPRQATLLLWLVFFVFGTNFAFQYLPWGLVFLLLAGHLRAALAVQLVALPSALIFYTAPHSARWLLGAYYAAALAVWSCWVALLAREVSPRGRRLPVTREFQR